MAPAFLLSGYSVLRRRATVVAQLVDLECRLNDAAVDMFNKMVFAKGRRGAERKYQAAQRGSRGGGSRLTLDQRS